MIHPEGSPVRTGDMLRPHCVDRGNRCAGTRADQQDQRIDLKPRQRKDLVITDLGLWKTKYGGE